LREEIVLMEKLRLIEKELETLIEKLETLNKDLKEIEDLKNEIKGLKLFLGRVHPEFKARFPEIMQKVYKKK
jgi:hypothetical protein